MKNILEKFPRRIFIKLLLVTYFGFIFKQNKIQACPLCWWFIRAIVGWGGRGALVESLTASAARSLAIGGVERAIVRSSFSQAAKKNFIDALKTANYVFSSYDIMTKLDKFSDDNPELVESHNKYENEIQAWWVTNRQDNPLTIELTNTTDASLNTKLTIIIKDKESSEIENSLTLPITSKPKISMPIKIIVSNLVNRGVKDVIAQIDHPDISPSIATVFVI